MAKEVDQASVDVIKLILESDNGKMFFREYLAKHLHISFTNQPHNVRIGLSFDNIEFTTVFLEPIAK